MSLFGAQESFGSWMLALVSGSNVDGNANTRFVRQLHRTMFHTTVVCESCPYQFAENSQELPGACHYQ